MSRESPGERACGREISRGERGRAIEKKKTAKTVSWKSGRIIDAKIKGTIVGSSRVSRRRSEAARTPLGEDILVQSCEFYNQKNEDRNELELCQWAQHTQR